MTRRLGGMVGTNIWFAGHRPTGAELERQADALWKDWEVAPPPRVSIVDSSSRLPEGSPIAVIGVPSNSTWARARHGRPKGPQPLRDRQWPWGFPWLSPADTHIVEEANAELRFIMSVFVEALSRAPEAFIILLHPEQLGPAQRGTPASIWDLPELRWWANQSGMMRAATFQCRFQVTDYRLPMGILVSHRLNSKLFDPGWPSLQPRAPHYQGPLPSFCSCGRGAHRTRRTATGRVEHRADASIIKNGLMRYLLATITREFTGLTVAELLRKGDTPTLQVRDDIMQVLDSSESQRTWIPTDSQTAASTELKEPHDVLKQTIDWDRELARILGLPTPSPTSSSTGSRAAGTTIGDHKDVGIVQNLQDQEHADFSEEVKKNTF